MQFLYFAYGSNMNFNQMKNRCPGSIFIRQARINNWSYFINGNGYAGIEEKMGSYTLGCIWALNHEHIKSLDRYEGVAEGCYNRIELKTFFGTHEKEEKALVYLSNNREYGLPSAHYQKEVIEGARNVGLPDYYIQSLEEWSFKVPNKNQTNISKRLN